MIQVIEAPGQLQGEFRRGDHAREYFQGLAERRVEEWGRCEVKGFGDLTDDVFAVLQRRNREQAARVKQECAAMAKAGGERYFIEDKEGGGAVEMQIHPASYHYWGQRLGYECWDDPQFCREYLRDNDYARVKSRSKQIRVGWRQGQDAASSYCRRKGKVMVK